MRTSTDVVSGDEHPRCPRIIGSAPGIRSGLPRAARLGSLKGGCVQRGEHGCVPPVDIAMEVNLPIEVDGSRPAEDVDRHWARQPDRPRLSDVDRRLQCRAGPARRVREHQLGERRRDRLEQVVERPRGWGRCAAARPAISGGRSRWEPGANRTHRSPLYQEDLRDQISAGGSDASVGIWRVGVSVIFGGCQQTISSPPSFSRSSTVP